MAREIELLILMIDSFDSQCPAQDPSGVCFGALTEAEQELVRSYMQSLHEIPDSETEIPPGAAVTSTFCREDPRLRSKLYRKALYHVSALKRLAQRGFEVPELHFVLDLDKTLVHCIPERYAENSLALQESRKRIKAETKIKDLTIVSYFQENSKQNWIVATRPGITEFLKKLKQIGFLHVCTQAELTYAKEIVKVIDPNRTYFGDRIHSQAMYPEKSLRVMFGDSYETFRDRILIIDDQPAVWSIEDQCQILPSLRFQPLIKFDQLSPTDMMNQKTLYYINKALPSIREENFDFSEASEQLDALILVLRRLHEKLFVVQLPITTLLQEFRQSLFHGQVFCLANLQEPRKVEKRLVLEHIIQALGGSISQDSGTFIVENSDPTGLPMNKMVKAWFLLREL